MIFSFESFCNKIKRNSEELVRYVVRGAWYGDTIKAFLIFCFFNYFFFLTVLSYSVALYYILYVVILMILVFYIATRKMGFGLSKNNFVYVRFKHFGFKEKEVYEIPFDKIKYLSVRKVFGFIFVKMSFLSNEDRFERIKFYYSSIIVGFSISEHRKNANEIYKKLKEIEKVLDRGDF